MNKEPQEGAKTSNPIAEELREQPIINQDGTVSIDGVCPRLAEKAAFEIDRLEAIVGKLLTKLFPEEADSKELTAQPQRYLILSTSHGFDGNDVIFYHKASARYTSEIEAAGRYTLDECLAIHKETDYAEYMKFVREQDVIRLSHSALRILALEQLLAQEDIAISHATGEEGGESDG